ncbi:hypothetical protein HRbin08_01526 [bacterium HR08]|nr:hypothetical protein HRbin08_01526 [bacterium HR08]
MRTTKVREIALLEQAVFSGRFREAERLAEELSPTDLRSAAAKAQVLIYKGELEEAGALLEAFEKQLTEANLKGAAEFGLAKAEWHYWRGEYEEAERQAQVVFGIYSLNRDRFGLARALYVLGRVHRRQGDYERARQEMLQALEEAEAVTDRPREFLFGLIMFNLGVIHYFLGNLARAEEELLAAIRALEEERGRYYGNALNFYGTLLIGKGLYEEAARVIQSAYECLSESAFFDDLAHATNNLAYACLRMGQFERASRLLHESLELRRRSKDIAGESATLELFGRLRFEQGQLEEAEQILRQAIELAELGKNPHEKAVALITLGRVLMAQGALDESQRALEEALDLAMQLKNKSLQAESHAYLAELWVHRGNGMQALEHLRRTKAFINGHRDAYLRAQIERIERLVQQHRIKAEEGIFMIRGSFLPTWREAHEMLGRFLLAEALRHAGENQTKAAELLGVTKAYITMLRKKYGI